MPRYELREGTSSKFWEITLDGRSFTTRFGRIGTDGQLVEKAFPTAAAARKEHDKIIADKLKKGYAQASAVPAGASAARPPRAKAARNPQLEKAIHDDPTDVDSYQVYGDWLQQHGDPLGELVAIDVGLRARKTAKLAAAREAHLDKHRAYLVGDLGDAIEQKAVELTWELGFIALARVHLHHDTSVDGGETLKRLLALPTARFLRELILGMASSDGMDNDYADMVKVLASVKDPPPLRRLYIGDYAYPADTEISWTHVRDLSKVWAKFPMLRALELQGRDGKLGDIDLPHLESFEYRSGGLDRKQLKSIATAHVPNLERLVVWTGSSDYGFDGSLKDLAPILDATGLPKLTHLGIVNSELANDLCAALPRSRVLAQLGSLDLSMGTMTDEGAQALLAARDAFKHLDALNLEDNLIQNAKLITALKGLCKKVEVDGQRELGDHDGEPHRYVAVGE